ncbi:Ankyrin repeats (3 copies) [Popillia japonica]|uniref:Ankyrin repeats (3 copies) n=1 Tax=Popillia japonica TaxID=7064 RepID=A0AAW1MIT1_POPJA
MKDQSNSKSIRNESVKDTAHIIGMMKDRTAYLKEEYLAGTKNLAFVVHDNSYPEIKICHDSPAIGSNARIYCPGGKLQQCFAQIENDPNFRDYKICQLQRIKNDLKLIRHDKYKFVCWFMDQHGEPLYNSEDNKSVPVIGQIVVLEEFNYVPRCLTKSTVSLSYFLSDNQEKQICLISGDAESMREQLEYEQDDIGIDAEDVANIFTEKRTYFIRVKDEEERQHYWIKLSGLGCPVFDIKIINGEMQITRRCNGLKHLGASIAYKGERITQQTLPMVETYLQTVQKQEGHNNSIFPLKKFQAVFKEALGFLSSDIISQLLRLQNVQNRKFQKFQQNGLAPKISVNGFKLDGELSPLHVASIYANVPLMENLIANNNVDVNAIDKFDCTPLHYILMGSSPSHLDGLKLLLKNGAHIDLQHPSSNRSSVPPITIAVHAKNTEAVRILLENGANPNIHGGRMLDTPLHVATKQGSYELVECLLDYDGNPNLKNRNGKTVLDIAGGNTRNDENIIRMLKERSGNVTDENGSQNSLLTIAAKAKQVITLIQDVKSSAGNGAEDTKIDFTDQEDHYDYCNDFHNINCFLENGENSNSLSLLFILNEINIKSNSMNLARLMLNNQGIELILEMGLNSHKIQDEDGCTLLHLVAGEVAGEGDEKLTKLLLEKDAEIDVQDRQGLTPLHYAAMKNCLNTASLLLLTPEGGKGANPNIQDKNGDTPLHLSAKNNYIHMTELLLANGAVCNVENEDGRTPLYFAVLTGNPNIVRLLLDDAADVHIFDNNGLTPLHFSDDVAVLKLLLQRGCDANIVNKENEVLPLICAIYRGNYDAIKTLILTGKARLDLADKNGNLPLHAAIDRKSIEIVQFLLSKGAQVNAANKDGVTALYCATYKKQPYIMDLLLRNGADINVRNSNLETSLHCAVSTARLDTVKILLDNKSDPNLQDNHGKTPLHIAATNGYTDIVEMLIQEHSVNINLADEDGITPLHCAVFTGRNGIVKLLADSQAVLDVKEKSGKTALYTAVEEGNLDLVKLLLQKQESLVNVANNYNSTPLHCALTENHLEIATLLIDKSASINMRDKNDDTPLHLAVKQEEPDIVAKLLDNVIGGHADFIRGLLEKGANINDSDENGVTPLHCAVIKENVDFTALLLEKGARVNAQDIRGNAPLHIAVHKLCTTLVKLLLDWKADVNCGDKNGVLPLHIGAYKGDINIVDLLLNKNGDINAQDALQGNTALHVCAEAGYGDIFKLLLEKGANPSFYNKEEGITPFHYAAAKGYLHIIEACELDADILMNIPDSSDNTLLHTAANYGRDTVLEWLLTEGVDVNVMNQHCSTPLHFAVYSNHLSSARLLLLQKEVDKEVDVNMKDQDGNTALHLATVRGNFDVVQLLLEVEGCDVNIANKQGVTPLQYSIVKQHDAITVMLLENNRTVEVNVRDNDGSTPLHFSVSADNLDLVKLLLDKGAHADISNNNLVTSLHIAVLKRLEDVIKLMLSNKRIDVNVIDAEGNTPLHLTLMIERQPSFELISNRDDSIFNYYEGNIIKPISYNIDDDDYIGIGKLFANDNDGNVTSSSSTNNTVRNTEIIYKPEADQLAIDEDHDKEDTLTFNFIFKQLKEESSLIEDTDTYCELLKIVDKNGETENSASYLPIINMIKGLIRGIFKQSSLAADLQNIIIPVTISARIQRDDVPTILFQLQNVGKTHQYFTCETNLKSRNPSISLFLSRGLNENSDTKSENHLSIVEYGTKKSSETGNLDIVGLLLEKGAKATMECTSSSQNA